MKVTNQQELDLLVEKSLPHKRSLQLFPSNR